MKRSGVGKKLKELRLAQGLSLREAARRLSLSASRLSDYEDGRTHSTNRPAIPGRDFLDRAARLYQYPAPALLGLAGHLAESPSAYFPSAIEADIAEIAALYERLPASHRNHLLEVVRTFRSYAQETPGATEPGMESSSPAPHSSDPEAGGTEPD